MAQWWQHFFVSVAYPQRTTSSRWKPQARSAALNGTMRSTGNDAHVHGFAYSHEVGRGSTCPYAQIQWKLGIWLTGRTAREVCPSGGSALLCPSHTHSPAGYNYMGVKPSPRALRGRTWRMSTASHVRTKWGGKPPSQPPNSGEVWRGRGNHRFGNYTRKGFSVTALRGCGFFGHLVIDVAEFGGAFS